MNFKNLIFALAVFLIAAYGITITFSAAESRFECNGHITYKNEQQPTSLYIKIEEYRWWVGLWGDSDGSLMLEIPNELLKYYSHIEEVGDQLQIHLDKGNLHGNFSKLSKILALKIPYYGFFDGHCIRVK